MKLIGKIIYKRSQRKSKKHKKYKLIRATNDNISFPQIEKKLKNLHHEKLMTWTLATISAVQNSARNPCPLQIRQFSAESRSLHLVVRALHSMLARVLSYPHQRAVSTSYSSSSITLMHFNL